MADASGFLGGFMSGFNRTSGLAAPAMGGTGMMPMQLSNSSSAASRSGDAASGPANASSAAYGSGLDGSGWYVNFGETQTANQRQDKSGSPETGGGMWGDGGMAGGSLMGDMGGGGLLQNPLILFTLGLVAWKIMRKKKSGQ